MGRRNRFLILTMAAIGWLPAAAAPVCAQGTINTGGLGQMPTMGSILGAQPGGIGGSGASASQSSDAPLTVNDSMASFIDSAVPRNILTLRFEGDYTDREPLRATYLFGKFTLPETHVDTLQLTSAAEFAFTPWLSVFLEAPYRWVSPTNNSYETGSGDISYGLKLCTWSSDSFIATILLRIYQPTASDAELGTGHWSIEPGLLAQYQFSQSLRLEGEFKYWQPLGGNQFSGDLIQYGLGLSYGSRKPGFWFAPVLEGVGWTVLSGETMFANNAHSFVIESASGQTIFNAYLGVRFGYGQNLDLYLGYGRSLTGDYWNRDTYRFELRFLY